MLDVVLRNLAFRHDRGFALADITFTVPRNTHSALIGPPACGASTLLRVIAGALHPSGGDVILGQRRINDLKRANRPLLFTTSELDVPQRWSVQHALVAAVRTRKLDREDRHREYVLAAETWELAPLLERRISTLSSTERTRVLLARIELLRPAVLLADRLLEGVSPSARAGLADAFFRMLRVHGTTVLTAPASREELAVADTVIVLDRGQLVQSGTPAEVFARPDADAAALATGEVDLIPITIRGHEVDSVIGSWLLDAPPFQGSGVALVRPSDFFAAKPGEDSDFVFGVEEAGFADGRWIATGVLSGGITLRVELPRETVVHKGRLLALRYDPARFRLLARETEPLQTRVPTDVVPPMRETR
ncbi:MAG TPA: ATP-binding cassette domain-containing protein [Thermoanaerobaculia bacterium]|nr:ATP-binding cassette domain-containing protein [Thermoanaerobaculia bacterium]